VTKGRGRCPKPGRQYSRNSARDGDKLAFGFGHKPSCPPHSHPVLAVEIASRAGLTHQSIEVGWIAGLIDFFAPIFHIVSRGIGAAPTKPVTAIDQIGVGDDSRGVIDKYLWAAAASAPSSGGANRHRNILGRPGKAGVAALPHPALSQIKAEQVGVATDNSRVVRDENLEAKGEMVFARGICPLG